MKKIRINELARECEQPNGAIIAILPKFGVTEKKTHSSSVDEDVAIKVRHYFGVFIEPGESPAATEPETETSRETGEQPETAAQPVPERSGSEAAPAAPVQPPPPVHLDQKPEPAAKTAPETPTEDRMAPRMAAQPLRPPLAGRPGAKQPITPPLARPYAAPPAARTQPAQPDAAVERQVSPSVTAPPAPARQAMPSAPPRQAAPPASVTVPKPAGPGQPRQLPPAAQIAPGTPRPAGPARPAPQQQRPGQIISGPRAPLPGGRGEAPRQPRPSFQQQRPAAGQVAPSAAPPNVVIASKPNLAGQPAARPVVPPRPDLVARLQQTKIMPGQPQPRPGVPLRPQSTPVPGQPIYTPRPPSGARPGQPGARSRPLPPGGPGGLNRGRGLHPTTPLRPEVPVAPVTDQRRGQKRAIRPEERLQDREGKMLRMPSSRREETGRLAEGKQITISEGITVKELSEKLGLKANLVIKKLVDRKIFATINQNLDVKMAEDLARQFGAITSRVSFEQETLTQHEAQTATEDETAPVRRPPVVTIMGHVDHGKTSLLDAIRLSHVAEKEAGGITQHIGAYSVEQNGHRIVFIDTPGHEAFTRMRARGAKVTDIVVLVVAADDGVMPQTLEAIDHAKAAKVPIIVAINKIDKPDAQPERVKQQLSDRGLLPEDWGGDTVMVPVSARSKQNLGLLLEMILLVADMQDLKANPERPAVASVLEAKLDRGRGPVATILVRNGTLRAGDFFISGSVFGKVRAMFDDRGQPLKEAGPSVPVEVIGLESLPEVGETLQAVTDTQKAKQIVIYRESKAREQALAKSSRLTLDQLHQQLKEGETKELPVIIKTDVGGTAEVLTETLQKLSTDKVRIRVIHSGVGAITETDVLLASASNAIIVGFNVRPDRNATSLAEHEKVDVRMHTIIYELTDEIKRAMTGMLEPVFREVYKGRVQVRDIFRISKVGTIAGCLVVDGSITRDSSVRVLRDNVVTFTGKLASLKRFKDDASEVRSGLECGIAISNFNDIKPGDVLEAFATERVATEAVV
jgi:translation initiation factor IF-2